MRTGFAQLPLHSGKAPRWLFSRMVRLSREILIHIITEYGAQEVLHRFSDPFWFQAFGCVLGFDWHSSGVTTTTCGAVKEGIKGLEKDLGFFAAGGKGAVSRKTPEEITHACQSHNHDPSPLVYASKMTAKVDSAAVQDGYQLYHHAFFFTHQGKWCVIQQGMSDLNGTARRYHWLGEKVSSFVYEPHQAICCDSRRMVLDLTAKESMAVQQASTAIASQKPELTISTLKKLPNLVMPKRHWINETDVNSKYLEKILLKTYERAPENFENLLGMQGVGPKTLRALTLVSELIYGARASTRDPARFSFAHGGKDGIPYPVDRTTYEKTIEVLHQAVNQSKIERTEKVAAFKRLSRFEP